MKRTLRQRATFVVLGTLIPVILLGIGIPLALGSWWGLAPLAVTFPFLIWRLLDEERFLAANLDGYRAYMATVRWRLAPGVF